MLVVLGNRDAVHIPPGGTEHERMPRGKRATRVELPDGISIADALTTIVHPQGVWHAHVDTSRTDSDGATIVPPPAWVAGDHAGLVSLVAEHFGGIEIRELEE